MLEDVLPESVDSSESEVVGDADRVLANEMVGAAPSETFGLSSAWR